MKKIIKNAVIKLVQLIALCIAFPIWIIILLVSQKALGRVLLLTGHNLLYKRVKNINLNEYEKYSSLFVERAKR